MLLAWLKKNRAEIACTRSNKVTIALLYCACMSALGLVIASLGPALLQLAESTQGSLRDVGYCFGARSAGYLLGSFGGPLFDRVPGHLALAGGLILGGIGSIFVPIVTNVYALGFVVSFQGAAMGFFDTGANVLLIYLFNGETLGPWMQCMHAFFAVGAFLAPMLLRVVEHRRPSLPGDTTEGVISGPGTYDVAFYIIGAYCLVLAAVLFCFTSPLSRKKQSDQRAKDATAAQLALSLAPATPHPSQNTAQANPNSQAQPLSNVPYPSMAEDVAQLELGLGMNTAHLSAVDVSTLSDVPINSPAGVSSPIASPATSQASKQRGGGSMSAQTHTVTTSATSGLATIASANTSHDPNDSDSLPIAVLAPDAPVTPEMLTAIKHQRWLVVFITAVLLGIYVGCETGKHVDTRVW